MMDVNKTNLIINGKWATKYRNQQNEQFKRSSYGIYRETKQNSQYETILLTRNV